MHLSPNGRFPSDLFEVLPVSVPHDSPGTVAFVIEAAGQRLGICTDLGSFNREIVAAFQNLDVLYLEFNHDLDMLFEGPYPHRLKKRVSSTTDTLTTNKPAICWGMCSAPGSKGDAGPFERVEQYARTGFPRSEESNRPAALREPFGCAQHEPSIWVDVGSNRVAREGTPTSKQAHVDETVDQVLAVKEQVALFSV